MDVCLLWVSCVLSSRGRCDGPITRPEGSYRLWHVVVCDLETPWKKRPPNKTTLHCCISLTVSRAHNTSLKYQPYSVTCTQHFAEVSALQCHVPTTLRWSISLTVSRAHNTSLKYQPYNVTCTQLFAEVSALQSHVHTTLRWSISLTVSRAHNTSLKYQPYNVTCTQHFAEVSALQCHVHTTLRWSISLTVSRAHNSSLKYQPYSVTRTNSSLKYQPYKVLFQPNTTASSHIHISSTVPEIWAVANSCLQIMPSHLF